jgi:phytoene synthase
LAGAYTTCRSIAKREAKNFYYAFAALPLERRNAICAIYAFMRQADDLADDESLPREERRRLLNVWLAGWHAPTGVPDTYATFADLYHYCYLVASVVGLVCIRIFGYRDPRAERLAEETGIAFQLTNILRDVAEDAARNRVYLPLDELTAHGVSLESLLHRASAAPPAANEMALLEEMARRAEDYYRSARELLPLIDPESRPALWALVSIYHALLKRIVRADYDVFSRRASVPLLQKLSILAVGLARMISARIF